MSRTLRWRAGLVAIAVLLAAALVALLGRADRVLDALEARVGRAQARVGARLRGAGVLAYWDFDAVRPLEAIGGTDSLDGGTRRVAGRAGHARAFLAGEHGLFRTALPLDALGERFTFSCWLRLPEKASDQQVFQYLAVRDGRIILRLPGQNELAGPAAPGGRFVHVAFTVDAPAREARLYVGGAAAGQLALQPLRHPPQPLSFGQVRVSPPPSFTLDEVSVWGRALTPAEVARLAGLRRSLAADTAAAPILRLRLAQSARDSYRALLLAADLFDPFRHEGRIYEAHLPSYALAMSRNDVRQFNKFFNEQQANGLTAPATSQKRRVELVEGGRKREAVMELVAGGAAVRADSAKRTLTLELLDDEGEPERKLLLRPIEGAPYLLEILAGRVARECAIPAAAPELCTVSVNGTFEGLHLCTELTREQGPYWLGEPGAWQDLLRRAPVFRAEVLEGFDRLAASLQGALTSDRKSPLTSREVLREVHRQRRLLEQTLPDGAVRTEQGLVAKVAESLGEDLFLGDNPHATLLVGDLDLSARTVNGAELSFASLTPGLLGDDGRVSPPEREPAPAALRVTVRAGAATRTRDLAFTVLPSRRPLPILRVQAAGDPPAGDPVASLVELIESTGRRSPLLEGRIRLRGNTSLFRGKNKKKYFRISLERPYDVPGVGRTRRLFLTSEWRDVTLMRERLAYDLFREFSTPGKPRYSPHARYVELVVNGDYKGVYLLTDRVDGDLLEFKRTAAGPDRAVLYKAMGEQANFQTPIRGAYVQKVPDWRDGEHWGPFDELIGLVGASTPEVFRERIERVVDVDSVIDFEILLAFTSNFEGRNYNLFLARKAGPDARFFIVPWDYDMTFYKQDVATNFLIGRLHRDLPGYSARVLQRWTSLRAGLLSERALTGRIDALAAELAGAAERNYRRWPPTPGETWPGKVQELRGFIATHLGRLDAHFGAAVPR
jgi:hypothetical protein